MSPGKRARMIGTAALVGGKIMHSATVQLRTWKRLKNSNKNPGCLGCIGDYTTQLYRYYNKPVFLDP